MEECNVCKQQSCRNCRDIANCAKYDRGWEPSVHGWQCQKFQRNNYCCQCGKPLGVMTVEEEYAVRQQEIKGEISKWPDWKKKAALCGYDFCNKD